MRIYRRKCTYIRTFKRSSYRRDNHTSCVSDQLDALREVFDEKDCLELLTEYYAVLSNKRIGIAQAEPTRDLFLLLAEDVSLPSDTRCSISGCEFDYSSNTYRLMVTLSAGTASLGENFLIVKVDGATGYPKVLSVK